jgi:hypothetical protein
VQVYHSASRQEEVHAQDAVHLTSIVHTPHINLETFEGDIAYRQYVQLAQKDGLDATHSIDIAQPIISLGSDPCFLDNVSGQERRGRACVDENIGDF